MPISMGTNKLNWAIIDVLKLPHALKASSTTRVHIVLKFWDVQPLQKFESALRRTLY